MLSDTPTDFRKLHSCLPAYHWRIQGEQTGSKQPHPHPQPKLAFLTLAPKHESLYSQKATDIKTFFKTYRKPSLLKYNIPIFSTARFVPFILLMGYQIYHNEAQFYHKHASIYIGVLAIIFGSESWRINYTSGIL